MANKQYPQGCGDGEEFRDNDIIGVYKPDDTPDVVDGSLNKKKTWLQVKTWIQNFVINTNTDNIAQNADDIDILNNLVNQDVKTSASPSFFDLALNGVASVKNSIISLLSRMTATENATGINASDIFSNSQDIIDNADDITILNNLVNQDVKTSATPTFVDVIITGLGAIKAIIQGILDKLDQGVKTTDDVEFNSVNTDNVALKVKQLTGTVSWNDSSLALATPHGLSTPSKIRGIEFFMDGRSWGTTDTYYFDKRQSGANILINIDRYTGVPVSSGTPSWYILITYEA